MIKLIIIDFGGVLYNIDYYKSIEELTKISSRPEIFENMSLNKILELPDEYEKGLISSSEFRNYLREKYFVDASDFKIDNAWNAMLLGLKFDAFDFVLSLKNKYQTALLSNTNEIHFLKFAGESLELFNAFDEVFLSFKMKMRKPSKEIYNFVCEKFSVKPSESLFIDDSVVNIEGAIECGLNIIHYKETDTLSNLLHTI